MASEHSVTASTAPSPSSSGECHACHIGRLVIGIALQLIGSLLISFLAIYALRLASGAQQAAPPPYVQEQCAGCPPGRALYSARVQQREGSILFAIGGDWPDKLADLQQDVRLEANDVDLVLRPHPDGFEVLRATARGAAIPPDALAAGLQSGDLLIDLRQSVLSAPVRFSFGFWDGKAYAGRLPADGALAWDGGRSAVQLASAPAATPAAASAASSAPAAAGTLGSSPAVDVTALAGRCSAIPTGTVEAYLALDKLGSGTEPDPRTRVPTRWLGASGSGGSIPAAGASRPPFSFTAIVSRAGAPNGTGSRPIDRLGRAQLWAYWDGNALHKGLREWNGSAWTVQTDIAADALTIALRENGIVFYWEGVQAGDSYALISAAAGGCRALGLGGSPPAPTERVP